MMGSKLAGLVLGLALALGPVAAQEAKKELKPAPSASQALLEAWNDVGKKIIAIAEDLPEDKYDYKPDKDARTFRGVVLHVSASMYFFTDLAQKQKPRYNDDPKAADLKINSKADLVAWVKKCVADGADLIKAKGDGGLNETVPAGPQLTRVGDLGWGLVEHSGEHYGNLVTYYRVNGMVPPESRPKK